MSLVADFQSFWNGAFSQLYYFLYKILAWSCRVDNGNN